MRRFPSLISLFTFKLPLLVFLGAFLLCTLAGLVFPPRAWAVVDPLSVPNNRIGVHILDTSELIEAAKLVNSGGGDWGYVTIPIRSDDRDFDKWSKFFIQARQSHLIPLLRLATYVDSDRWVAPTPYDLVDFANFLDSLPWPTKNRYVILFNEPNHANEYGGRVDPARYARLLVDARDIFKAKHQDFYLISAGLDMSAPTNGTSLDALEYYRRMTAAAPGWFSAVDGLAVHAYPNPGFSASVYSSTRYGITSYRYELAYLQRLGFSGKPLFLTETGTLASGEFFKPALTEIWTEPDLIAITPFLLFAGTGPFAGFSLLDTNHQPTSAYLSLFNLPKIAGSPLLSPPGLFSQLTSSSASTTSLPASAPSIWAKLKRLLSPPRPTLTIGDSTTVSVEIASTDATRAHGLSDRLSLPPDAGMLFVFDSPRPLTFWMKDMHFPLDFIWIAQHRVVELHRGIPPPSQTGGIPQIVRPVNLSDSVLEVNAGFIDEHHIQVGDPIVLNSP